MADVVKTRGAAITVVEKAPVGKSVSIALFERGVQSVEVLIRTLAWACVERVGIKIKCEEKFVVSHQSVGSLKGRQNCIREKCRAQRARVTAIHRVR